LALKDVAKFLGVDFTTLDDLPTDLEINYKQLSWFLMEKNTKEPLLLAQPKKASI
jgi:hypothetical protein